MIFKFRYLPKGSLVVKPIVNVDEDKLVEENIKPLEHIEIEVEAPTFIEAERLFNLAVKKDMFRKVDEIYNNL